MRTTASAASRTSPRRSRRASHRPASPASGSSRGSASSIPTSLDAYRASGGFGALERARRIGPQQVIDEVGRSGLVGRGGAAFPTGRKWAAVAQQAAQPHYLVCNADESEPGTFSNRVLMEADPFAVVESIAIAAFAVGAEKAFVYVRGEYPLAEARLANAIEQSRGRRAPRRARHRAPARRRRLHLRRGDGALRVDRGQARRAAQQAAVPGRGRAVRQADRDQQRRDARQRPR